MERKEPYNRINLSDKEKYHRELMVAILRGLRDTPLVLKGGTALYLGYGLTRFSEDLDFDAAKKLNLLSKIKNSIPYDIKLNEIHVKKDTDSVSRYIINYFIPKINETNNLKMEISYRTPIEEKDVYIKDGIRFASIEKIIDYKLKAAFDGACPRSKVRDLYDLHYLAFNYSHNFSKNDIERLFRYSKNPDELVDKYKDDLDGDNILSGRIDLETISIELSEKSENLYKKINSYHHDFRNSNFIDVPYREKDEAKKLGAKWDKDQKCWYIPKGEDIAKFDKWHKVEPKKTLKHENILDDFDIHNKSKDHNKEKNIEIKGPKR